MIALILSTILAYLVGSIPFGYILTKLIKGVDVRTIGSGNIGATNVSRALGKTWGIITLILDALKGLLVVLPIADFALDWSIPVEDVTFRVILGISVVCGHNWTLFLGFKGGKGMATSLGVLIGLAVAIPQLRGVLLVALTIWLLAFLLTSYVSLSSLLSAFSAPFLMFVFKAPTQIVIFGSLLCIFIFIRHRSNIKRLMSGEEHKIRLFKK